MKQPITHIRSKFALRVVICDDGDKKESISFEHYKTNPLNHITKLKICLACKRVADRWLTYD